MIRSFLCTLAASRCVHVCVEQPMNSFFYEHPSMKAAIRALEMHRFITYLGALGGTSLKPIELYVLAPANLVKRLRVQPCAEARLSLRRRGGARTLMTRGKS